MLRHSSQSTIGSAALPRMHSDVRGLFDRQLSPEPFVLSKGNTVWISKYFSRFHLWIGAPVADTYGGKLILDVDRRPAFAELAVLHLFQERNFDGVWVDTFRGKFRQSKSDDGCDLPIAVRELYTGIAARNGSRKGCWDVLAWKDDKVVFAECKRRGKDTIRKSQTQWLESALDIGIDPRCFLVCEWEAY